MVWSSLRNFLFYWGIPQIYLKKSQDNQSGLAVHIILHAFAMVTCTLARYSKTISCKDLIQPLLSFIRQISMEAVWEAVQMTPTAANYSRRLKLGMFARLSWVYWHFTLYSILIYFQMRYRRDYTTYNDIVWFINHVFSKYMPVLASHLSQTLYTTHTHSLTSFSA